MIQTENWEGVEVYKIENKEIALWLAPSLGNNLYRIKDKKRGIDILKSPKNPELLRDQSVLWGTPILFPPNRIRGGSFTFDKRKYSFPINTIEGHHIHGLVHDKPWRFETLSDKDDELSVTCSLDFSDFPELQESYPNHLKLEVTYNLSDRLIEQAVRIHNIGTTKAPIGYGLHTWFSLLGGRSDWNIKLPFESIWELDDDVMPTGKLVSNSTLSHLRNGISLANQSFDTIFYVGKGEREVILTRNDGYTIAYFSSDEFLHWVLHTPHDQSGIIAIEPYTWITDAPHLTLPVDKTGFRTLDPKKTFECKVILALDFTSR